MRELKIEKCQQKKFGSNYKHLFTNGEFNNSYCINKFDFDLRGGFIYENISLINIDFLKGGYFSILLKDIGLNPNNYSYPILPMVQDIYITVSSQFYKNLILYYEITEIKKMILESFLKTFNQKDI